MSSMYRENIIQHFKNPLFKGKIEEPSIHFHDSNPVCGDDIEVMVKLDENGKVIDAKFEGVGCAISIASTDMLLEEIIGKDLAYIESLTKDDIIAMLGIPLTPVRLKCAILGLKVLQAGTLVYKEKKH